VLPAGYRINFDVTHIEPASFGPLLLARTEGFGSAALEALRDLGIATPVVRVGWPDQFIEHGKIDALRAKYGLTVDAAMEKLAPHLQSKSAKVVARPA
jgi:hypothetical protein